jgi:hypothetical protein
MALSNKNKTVSPLIISKSRIQSVPNQSAANIQEDNSNDGWITPTPTKRNQTTPNASPKSNKQFITPNRFALFSNQHDQTNSNPTVSVPDISMDDTHPVPKLPPPIFIRLVNDFKSFCTTIHSVTNGEAFTCKSSTNGLKLSTSTPTSYRNVIKFLKDSKADFHTYQPKQERAFRIVVRNLHHTTSISDIEQELLSHGHTVRNITNVLQYNTKRPLPLFFIDLEQADNNKEVFKIEFLCYSKIKIEEPRVKRHIVQCLRCQDYGHTKSYCNHSPNCVRCGEQHLSETCQKPTNQPPKCVLCKGEHPANYRGCPKHKEIQSSQLHRLKTSQHSGLPNQNLPVKKVSPNTVNTTSNSLSHHKTSYAQVTKEDGFSPSPSSTHNTDELSLKMSSFLDNLKNLINPLISLLTTVINKLLSKSND